MIYKCIVCCKQFTQKSNFERHMNRKNPCKLKKLTNEDNKTQLDVKQNVSKSFPNVSKSFPNVSKTFSNNEIKYKCLICNKFLLTRSGLFKHKKKHLNYEEEVKKINTNNKNEEEIILLKQKLEITEKKLETIEMNQICSTAKKKSSKNKTINNGTINNVIINGPINNGNVHNGPVNNVMVNFGNENLTKFSDNEIEHLLFNEEKPLLKLIEMKHFNTKFPEQQNIQLTNLRSNYMDVYENNIWSKKLTADTSTQLFNKSATEIISLKKNVTKENQEKISKPINRTIDVYRTQFIKKYFAHKDTYIADRDTFLNETKLLMYNKTKEFHHNQITNNVKNKINENNEENKINENNEENKINENEYNKTNQITSNEINENNEENKINENEYNKTNQITNNEKNENNVNNEENKINENEENIGDRTFLNMKKLFPEYFDS